MPRTRPRAYAGAEALRTVSVSSTTTALLRSTREDGRDLRRVRRAPRCVRERGLLAVADVPREHGSAGDDGSEEGGEERLRRRVHAYDRTADVARRSLPRRRGAPNVHAQFTSVAPTGHLAYLRSAPCVKPSTTSSTRSSTTSPRSAPGRGGRLRRHRGAARRATPRSPSRSSAPTRPSTGPASGSRTRRSPCSPCSSRSPATCGSSSPRCGWSTELERMGDLSVHVAKIARLRVPNVAVPEEIRPTISRMAEVAEDMVGRSPAIIAERDVERRPRGPQGRRGDGPAAAPELRRAALATAGRTASRPPSTSPCSAATTSGSPTTPSRSPTGSSTSSPASSPPPCGPDPSPSFSWTVVRRGSHGPLDGHSARSTVQTSVTTPTVGPTPEPVDSEIRPCFDWARSGRGQPTPAPVAPVGGRPCAARPDGITRTHQGSGGRTVLAGDEQRPARPRVRRRGRSGPASVRSSGGATGVRRCDGLGWAAMGWRDLLQRHRH